jgi:hypothetical protein
MILGLVIVIEEIKEEIKEGMILRRIVIIVNREDGRIEE